jgi:Fe-S cluster biogenesis protein NfuA
MKTMESIEDRIERALIGVRPYLHADGGDVRFVRYRPEGIAEVCWEGTCRVCPMSMLTLRAGVERTLMQEVPEIKRVEAIAG